MCCKWFAEELSWLPILVGILLLSSIVIPYCIAIGLGHVTAGLPFISDTGATPPESCVFGQLLNTTAAAAFACIYIRYKQIQLISEGNLTVICMNKLGMVLGLLSCLGMSLVANFQETNVLTVHMIGASMCFGLGTIYSLIQTWISYQSQGGGRKLNHTRLVLSIACVILFLMTMIFTSISMHMYEGNNPLKWESGDTGFAEHIVAATSEWLMAISFLMYFWTYIPDFRYLSVTMEVHATYLRIPGGNFPEADLQATM